MTTIKEKHFTGGRGLTEAGNLDEILREVADDLGALQASTPAGASVGAAGYVYSGGLVSDPTTPSSQLTGAGNTTWNVNVSAADAQVNSVDDSVAASADESIHSGSNLLSAVGKAIYAYVVLAESGGAIAIDSVKGTEDDLGSEVAPTDAEITTGVGHANWIKLALIHLSRTADTTVVQTQTNAGVGQASAAAALTHLRG
jgi:hypothetical protein